MLQRKGQGLSCRYDGKKEDTLIAVYCKSCDGYTPLTLDRIQMSPDSSEIAGDVTCASCSAIITTVKADENGAYALAKVIELAVPSSSTIPDASQSSEGGVPRLRLIP